MNIKTTLGITAVGTAALLAGAVCKTPKIPENETTIEQTLKQAEDQRARTYYWNDRESIAQNVINGVETTGEIIKQDVIDKATDHPLPLTFALVAESLGIGLAGAAQRRRKNNELQAQQIEEQRNTDEQQAAQRRVEAENVRRLEEERIAAEEAKKSKIGALDRSLKYHTGFNYSYVLNDFGVSYGAIPIKKVGSTEPRTVAREFLISDANRPATQPEERMGKYEEHYLSKDGKTVVAGIEFGDVPKGVDEKDYTYRYVRLLEPTIEGKVTEIGKVHYIDENGHVVEYDVEFKLNQYNPNEQNLSKKRIFSKNHKYMTSKSKEPVKHFPPYEHQKRKEIASNFVFSVVKDSLSFDRPSIARALTQDDFIK